MNLSHHDALLRVSVQVTLRPLSHRKTRRKRAEFAYKHGNNQNQLAYGGEMRVTPVLKPTVPNADMPSKNRSRNRKVLSVMLNKSTATKTKPMAMAPIIMARCTCSNGISLP